MNNKSKSTGWIMLLLMLASFSVTFMTRFIWAPLNVTVTDILGLSNAAAGSFMSAFFIGYVITQIPGGVLADRFGVKIVLSAGVLLTGLASIGMSFITTYSQGFTVRVITGLGAGVVMSCCSKVISEYFEQKDRGIAFGILLVGPTLGLNIANKLGAYLLQNYSWHTAFQVVGYIAVGIAVIVFFMIKNNKSEGAVTEKVTLLSGIKAVFTSRNLIGVCLAGFFYMFLNLGTSTWANAYLGSLGYDIVTAAGVMSMYSIAGIVGSILTGLVVKKLNLNVKYYLLIVFVIIAVSTLLFGFQADLGALKVVGMILGFVTYLPNAHLNALITKYAPDKLAGSAMGVQNCVFQMASILSPIVIGWTVDLTGNFGTCWYALSAMPMIGLLFLFLIKEKKVSKE